MRTFAVALLLATIAAADVVHLRNGGKIEGRVTDKGDRVEVQTAEGTVTIEKTQIERIEKKEFTPPPRLLPRRPAVKRGDPYSHPFYAFKLYLPPGWQRGKEQGRANASFWGPKEQFYQPRMDLFVEFEKRDLPDTIARYKEAFRKAFANCQFAFEETLTVEGNAAYQFSAVFSDGEPPIPQQSLWTFVTADERKYILSFNCTQAWFDKYHAVIDASMRSLRVYPLPAASGEQKRKFVEHYSRGEAAFREGKWAEALSDFEEAARLVPEYPDLHSTLGAVYMREGRFSDAETAFRKAAELDPRDGTHPYNLGVCLLKQSKYEGAIEVLKRAAERDPGFEPGFTNLGVAYLARDLNEPARQALEKAIRINPESAPAHYNLGLAHERLDRRRDAEREYRQALSADPGHSEARQALERLKSRP